MVNEKRVDEAFKTPSDQLTYLFDSALELSRKYSVVEPSLGVYPTETINTITKELKFIEENKDKIIAIGECGLDYLGKNQETAEQQRKNFEKVVKLAKKLNKPIIVHSRKAEKDVLEILEKLQPARVVMHCFTANTKLVKQAEEMGCFFSIPTVITRLQHYIPL